jgi:hypothetical protein
VDVSRQVSTPEPTTAANALDDIKFRLATAEFTQAVQSVTAPLWWPLDRDRDLKDRETGTAFFVRTKTSLIGVTAAHVIEAWKYDCEHNGASAFRITGWNEKTTIIDWAERKIDLHGGIDIATFKITGDELADLNLSCLIYNPEPWPTKVGEWVSYCGFPGQLYRRPSPTVRLTGMCVATGKLTALNDRQLTVQLERPDLEPMWEGGMPPEGFSFGGMSGGPVIRNFLTPDGNPWAVLGGVISVGRGSTTDPEGQPVQRIEELELITASRAEFILDDGMLDTDRWDRLP